MKKVDSKYKDYSLADFLNDEAFLSAQLLADAEQESYWDEVARLYPYQKKNMEAARQVLRSVKINSGSLSRQEEDAMLVNIHARYRRNRIRRVVWQSTGMVASLLLFFALSMYLLIPSVEKSGDALAVASRRVYDMDSIQDIRLIVGAEELITEEKNAEVVWTEKNEIAMKTRSSETVRTAAADPKLEYSTLLVPYGKRSFMEFQDGTRLWINSGTEVRFPTDLRAGKERRIYVDGEIYIEVAKDRQRPFLVETSNFEVAVYGTKFNVTSYKADSRKSVVLVEGSVAVRKPDRTSGEQILLSNQMYYENGVHTKIANVDAAKYIAWKNGLWQFDRESLGSIALRLSRYYGVKVNCVEQVARKTCTGNLVLFDDINQTLQTLKEIFGVDCETGQNNEINIK